MDKTAGVCVVKMICEQCLSEYMSNVTHHSVSVDAIVDEYNNSLKGDP